MKRPLVSIALVLLAAVSHAQEKDAEALLASKQRAEMTYRQLMEILGEASSMMHMGILRHNQQMVKMAGNIILTHPAPNHSPWTIIAEEDRAGFKQSLLAYDEVLDAKAQRVIEEAGRGDWTQASNSLHEMNLACLSCHAMWRDKAKY